MFAFFSTAPPLDRSTTISRTGVGSTCPPTTEFSMTASNPTSLALAMTQTLLFAKPSRICTPPLTSFLFAWADLFSLLLLTLSLAVGGINPNRRVWGHSPTQNVLLTLFMALNITYSAMRYILEGLCIAIGPREFLFVTVIYSARWIWLFLGITKSGTRSEKAFKVARAMRELKTIRLGSSTADKRKGARELVVRRGARVVNGDVYWRGVEEHVQYDETEATYLVRLVEKELHSNLLDTIGTTEFKQKIGTGGNDELYKRFYDLVMTVDAKNEGLVVDYKGFLNEFGAVSRDTRQAQRVGAVDEGELGDVARRVAADACYYIWFDDGEFRTNRHVMYINECVEDAAKSFFDQ